MLLTRKVGHEKTLDIPLFFGELFPSSCTCIFIIREHIHCFFISVQFAYSMIIYVILLQALLWNRFTVSFNSVQFAYNARILFCLYVILFQGLLDYLQRYCFGHFSLFCIIPALRLLSSHLPKVHGFVSS